MGWSTPASSFFARTRSRDVIQLVIVPCGLLTFTRHFFLGSWCDMRQDHILGMACGYYLSREPDAYRSLGFGTMNATHEALGHALGVPAGSIKNWRDEFDPVHDNGRAGWHKRPMVPSRIRAIELLCDHTADELYMLVRDASVSPLGPAATRFLNAASGLDSTVRDRLPTRDSRSAMEEHLPDPLVTAASPVVRVARSWLTTHYPHFQPDTEPWDIYLQRKHLAAVDGILPGDRVFFYEFATRRAWRCRPDHPSGAQGIVRVGYVAGPVFKNREGITEYEDGSAADWCWQVPVDRFETAGYVSRERMCGVLGFKPKYTLRGFNGGTGVKVLDATQASDLHTLFTRSVAHSSQAVRIGLSGSMHVSRLV